MLVAVDQELGLCPFDVRGQCVEAVMDAVIAVVDMSGRVMRQKNIHRREGVKQELGLGLFVEEMAFRFILPSAVEPAEAQSAVFADLQMKIDYRVREWSVPVMVSLDGEDAATAIGFRGLEDHLVIGVAT